MTTPTFEVQVIELLNDLARKMVRLETRMMRLADAMHIDVKKQEKQDENVQ